jgi:hypothetical protein
MPLGRELRDQGVSQETVKSRSCCYDLALRSPAIQYAAARLSGGDTVAERQLIAAD